MATTAMVTCVQPGMERVGSTGMAPAIGIWALRLQIDPKEPPILLSMCF